jgi:hypothetical protein
MGSRITHTLCLMMFGAESRETLMSHREPASERISKELADVVQEETEEGDHASAACALNDGCGTLSRRTSSHLIR